MVHHQTKTLEEYLKKMTHLFASLTLRGLALIPILFWLGEKAFPLLAILGGLYYLTMLWHYRYALHFSRPVATYLLTPVVEVVMDVGMEWGRILSLVEGPYKR